MFKKYFEIKKIGMEEDLRECRVEITEKYYQDEDEFTERYVTRERIDILLAKLKGIGEEIHINTLIPRLLTLLYYEVINEKMYEFISKKDRVIDFKVLKQKVTNKIKELTPEIFNEQKPYK